jgi:hypothetical protein
MATLYRLLNVHREVIEAIDFKGIANATQNKQNLHIDWRTVGTYWSCNVV